MHSAHCITGQMSSLESDANTGVVCRMPGLGLCLHLKKNISLLLEMVSYDVGIVPFGLLDLG